MTSACAACGRQFEAHQGATQACRLCGVRLLACWPCGGYPALNDSVSLHDAEGHRPRLVASTKTTEPTEKP